MALGYLASLSLWFFAAKSAQFYFHYFIPHIFLLGALAFALEEFWRRGQKPIPIAVLAGSLAMLAWFYPILTAGALADPMDFFNYVWIKGWR